MKTVKILTSSFLLLLCLVSFGQSSTTSTKKSVYYVQTSHTPEQCLNNLTEMKVKGDTYLSKFEFGCMSGDHTGYAFLEGTSVDNVRQMLPKDAQATAKIEKVDRFTVAQIEQLHKDQAKK
jgi:hypothetical protein